MGHIVRRTLLPAFLAVLLIPAAVMTAGNASAATTVTTGSVTGTVVNASSSAALSGICVNVIDASDNQTVGTSHATRMSGIWTLTGISPSTTYTAVAGSCKSSNTSYVAQWYDDQQFQSNATDFTVSAGKTTRAIDFSLSEGGAVAGTVTDSATKAPVAGILVIAFYTTAYQVSTYAECTTSNGAYKLSGIPTSGAKVEFLPNDCGVTSNYGDFWYDNQSSYDTATVVPVSAGVLTRRINQAVTTGGAS
jgi:hypothetical protein